MEVGGSFDAQIAVMLKSLLLDLATCVGSDFSGIGVIVWDGMTPLPTRPLRDHLPDWPRVNSTRDALRDLSRESSDFHDGFHVLGPSLQLVQPSVYFSPAIVDGLTLPAHARFFGGRYLAAAFGSHVPGVLCTGVLSANYGPYVLLKGREA